MSTSLWQITPEDRANYDKVFAHFDRDNAGVLTDDTMEQVLTMTKSAKQDCARVWELTNPDGDATFTKAMFLMAMHLLYKKK